MCFCLTSESINASSTAVYQLYKGKEERENGLVHLLVTMCLNCWLTSQLPGPAGVGMGPGRRERVLDQCFLGRGSPRGLQPQSCLVKNTFQVPTLCGKRSSVLRLYSGRRTKSPIENDLMLTDDQ